MTRIVAIKIVLAVAATVIIVLACAGCGPRHPVPTLCSYNLGVQVVE
jgi:hypothetical protein